MRSLSESPSPAPAPAAREEPSLLPREHGAWGQLAMPLATGLALGRPGAAALLLVAGIVLAFLAHEPLLVVLGQRGRRVKEALGARAARRLAALGAAAVVCGVTALLLASPAARLAALAPAALALPVAPLVAATRGLLPWPAALGVLPTALAAAAVALLRVRPQRFTTVGWSLVGASLAALLVLVVGFRAG